MHDVIFRGSKEKVTKFPQAKISFVVRNDFKDLIEHNPFIEHKIYFERKKGLTGFFKLLGLRKKLANEKFDIIIDAHSTLRSLVLTSFMKASFKARYSKTRVKRLLLFLFKINLLAYRKTQENEFARLLLPIGIEYDNKGSDLFFNPSHTYNALLRKHNLVENSYLCIVPGAAWKGKQLKTSFYNELIKMIEAQHPSMKIVLLGGRLEIERNGMITGSNLLNLTNQLSLLESIFIAARARLSIGSDTGLMHAAEAASGSIGLFLGPTSKETGAYPSKRGSIVFEKDIFCRPCSKNGSAPCIFGLGLRRCLNFDPKEVYDELSRFL